LESEKRTGVTERVSEEDKEARACKMREYRGAVWRIKR
jgi:hypothetical protein